MAHAAPTAASPPRPPWSWPTRSGLLPWRPVAAAGRGAVADVGDRLPRHLAGHGGRPAPGAAGGAEHVAPPAAGDRGARAAGGGARAAGPGVGAGVRVGAGVGTDGGGAGAG